MMEIRGKWLKCSTLVVSHENVELSELMGTDMEDATEWIACTINMEHISGYQVASDNPSDKGYGRVEVMLPHGNCILSLTVKELEAILLR